MNARALRAANRNEVLPGLGNGAVGGNYADANFDNPLPIPINADGRYMRFSSRAVILPVINDKFPMPIVEVIFHGDNRKFPYVNGQPITDVNYGMMIKNTFTPAYEMARHRMYMHNLSQGNGINVLNEQQWILQMRAEHNTNPVPVRVGDNREVPAVLLEGGHLNYNANPNAIPRVRCIIYNVPGEIDGVRNDLTLPTVPVKLPFNNDDLAVRRLFTSITMQSFSRSYQGLKMIGSEVYEDYVLLKGVRADITIKYIFFFVNKGATQLLSRANIEALNFPPVGGPRGRAPTRVIRENQLFAELGPIIGNRNATNNVVLRNPINHRTIFQDLGQAGFNPDTSYGIAKRSIFIKKRITNIFTFSRAVLEVPNTDDHMCFPMAFMRSQARMNFIENNSVKYVDDEYLYTLQLSEAVVEYPPEETRFWDPATKTIKVFECEKRKVRIEGYDTFVTELSPHTVKIWHWCAKHVHMFVCNIWGEFIDPENLGLCMKAYSQVFSVNISVYRMDMGRGKRIAFEANGVCAENGSDSFISVLFDNGHLHAISNFTDFIQNDFSVNKKQPYQVCDYCQCSSFSWKNDYKHQDKCRKINWTCTMEAEVDGRAQFTAKRNVKRLKYPNQKKDKNEGVEDPGSDDENTPGKALYCNKCCGFQELHPKCRCVDPDWREGKIAECTRCGGCCVPLKYNQHDCYMKPRKHKEKLDDTSIWVYDIESMQVWNENIGEYEHVCIWADAEQCYGDERIVQFNTMGEFTEFMMNTGGFDGGTIISHNGGAYDNLFLLKELEKRMIPHSAIPRPNSIHRYLQIVVHRDCLEKQSAEDIHFIDFFMMFSAGLKSIAKAFKLPVEKGDFPHRFSKPEHLNYKGPLPPMFKPELDHEGNRQYEENDWFSLCNCRSEEDRDEAIKYWEEKRLEYCQCEGEHCCDKPLWDFMDELKRYCRLDVKVLKAAVKAFRQQILAFSGESEYDWSVNGIEPFKYMTQGMIALAMFVEGKAKDKIAITFDKLGPYFKPGQIMWLEGLMNENSTLCIQHAGNWHKEFYDIHKDCYLTGYCHATNTAYLYMDCYANACSICYQEKINNCEIHPDHGIMWKTVNELSNKRVDDVKSNVKYWATEVHWSHSDMASWANDRLGNLMNMRDPFFGGRTEVFAAYCNIEKFPTKEMIHIDVCSLYPYVCSWCTLPTGIPKIFFGKAVDINRLSMNHRDPYYGFVRCRMSCNPTDLIGCLPQRRKFDGGDEKLCYDLLEKEGCWHTSMIYLALEHGYKVLEIFEVWHYDKDNRTDQLMRGYMEFFLRMKQEAEGWEDLGTDLFPDKADWNVLTEDEKDQICEYIFRLNGGFARPRKERVAKNPVMRQLAKIFLNCLWGKLVQRQAKISEKFVFGMKQYLEIISDFDIDQESVMFRHLAGGLFKACFEYKNIIESNPFLNVAIAASVTAEAQCILMRRAYELGEENILYCDTDSLIILREKGLPPVYQSGLGNWTLEHRGAVITEFAALAPKSYALRTVKKNKITDKIKTKGVTLTNDNKEVVNFTTIKMVIDRMFRRMGPAKKVLIGPREYGAPMQCDTMCIHPNVNNAELPYATLLTRYGKKDVRCVYSKRQFLTADDDETIEDMGLIRLVPFGYQGVHGNIMVRT